MSVEEKDTSHQVEKLAESSDDVDVKIVVGSEAYAEALLKEPPSWASPTTWRLVGCILLGCFCQTMNGYDGSVFSGLTANTQFLAWFHGSNLGNWPALNSALYQIGGIVAIPFIGPAIDTWGRKVGMQIGAWIIIIGTIINSLTNMNSFPDNVKQLQAGRFVLGFGVSIVSSAGPIYVVEAAHPAWRGILTAYCNTFWFTGSILASGAVRGAIVRTGVTSWTIPLWLQLVFPALIVLFAWLIPESPRWLYVHNRREKATAILTDIHGYGNPDSVWVKLELDEYEAHLNMNGADKRYWDYRALFRNRSSIYRLVTNCSFSICGQWAGNGVLTYFLSGVLTTAGFTNEVQQANVILGYACFQFAFALVGASLVDKLGRRRMMISSLAACTIVWIGMTAASAMQAAHPHDPASGKAVLAMIFLFGAAFSTGITPLQALYPVEVLSYEMRAKGMAFSNLAVSCSGLLNQFAWPIALKNITWKTYIVFVVWDAITTAFFYLFMPETRNRTLEELDQVFEARNPVKASLQAHKVAVASDGTILASDEL